MATVYNAAAADDCNDDRWLGGASVGHLT